MLGRHVFKNKIIKYLIILGFSIVFTLGTPLNIVSQTNESFDKIVEIENSKLKLILDKEFGQFSVIDLESNMTWRSNPEDYTEDTVARDVWKTGLNAQLIVYYSSEDGNIQNTVNSYLASSKNGNMKVTVNENGYEAKYYFEKEDLEIPLKVEIKEDILVVTVDVNKIINNGSYIITKISVLPFFGCGSSEDEGFLFVPSGSGGIIEFNNGRYRSGDFIGNVYGDEQANLPATYKSQEETIRIPVYGIAKNGSGFISIITSADEYSEIRASVSMARTSYNTVYSSILLKEQELFYIKDETGKDREYILLDQIKDKVGEYRLEYHFSNNGDYPTMAELYKNYLIRDKNLIKREIDDNFLMELHYQVMKKQLFLGIPINTAKTITDYQDTIYMIDYLKRYGIENISLQMNNATKDTVHDNVNSSLRLSSRLGDKKDYEKILESIGSANVYLNFDPVLVKKNGIFFGFFNDFSKMISGTTAYMYEYDLETNLKDDSKSRIFLSPDEVNKNTIKLLAKEDGKNLNIDSIGSLLYSNFGRKNISRIETSEYFKDALDSFDRDTGKLSLSEANAYLFENIDQITNMPVSSSSNAVINYGVPFLQMALSGLIDHWAKPLNLSSNPNRFFMKCMEFGTKIHFSFIGEDTYVLKDTDLEWLYSADFDMWKEDLVGFCEIQNTILQMTENTGIIFHEKIGDDLYESRFKNGVKLVTDYESMKIEVVDKRGNIKNFKIEG